MLNTGDLIRMGAMTAMTEKQFFEKEIAAWKLSNARQQQITGEKYYRYQHDILKRQRTVIGQAGKLEVVENLPNNRLIDNQYAKMVDQKTNYLLGNPMVIKTENEAYDDALKSVFNKKFHRMFSNLGEDSLNGGIGWLHVYYDERGRFSFKRFAPYEMLPFWKDDDHTELDVAIRVYGVEAYEGNDLKIIEKVEVYRAEGIERYTLDGDTLYCDGELTPYMVTSSNGATTPYNWARIPLIAFKYNDEEIPLISKVKSLQDALNETISDFQNNIQEDSRNTILVIKNYDGENLGEFRRNLATYGAVKVKTVDGADGAVEALQVDVNADNYKAVQECLKQAIIDNAMGFDAKVLKSGSPNQMNIKSIFTDIDLDANGMETEFQASLEDLMTFINAHLANTGHGDFTGEDVEFIFNRDMLLDEDSIITSARNSVGIISNETIVANHPWVDNVFTELGRIEDEKTGHGDGYGAFPGQSEPGENAAVSDTIVTES